MTLVADSVTLRRGGRCVLENVSMAVRLGECVGVLGANGAGKSSLLAVLAGELPPTSGHVNLGGMPLMQIAPMQLAQRRAVLPQRAGMEFDMTARAVVAMGAYPFPAFSPDQVDMSINDAMARADVLPLASRRYTGLSGGEQQRVHLARVLVQVLADEAGPGRYLLLDEPTASQDPAHQLRILHSTRELATSRGLGVVAVLHDMNLAAGWCDRVVLLADGRVWADGPPQQVRSIFDPAG